MNFLTGYPYRRMTQRHWLPRSAPNEQNDSVPKCLVVDDDSFTRVTVAAALEGRAIEIAAVVGSVEEAMGVNPRLMTSSVK